MIDSEHSPPKRFHRCEIRLSLFLSHQLISSLIDQSSPPAAGGSIDRRRRRSNGHRYRTIPHTQGSHPPSHPPDEIPRWCLFKSDSSFLPTVAEFVSCSVRRLNMQSVDGVLSERKTTFSFVAVSVDLCCPMVQRMQHVGANLSESLMNAVLNRYRQILRLG